MFAQILSDPFLAGYAFGGFVVVYAAFQAWFGSSPRYF
jgi:hypothetical protein